MCMPLTRYVIVEKTFKSKYYKCIPVINYLSRILGIDHISKLGNEKLCIFSNEIAKMYKK